MNNLDSLVESLAADVKPVKRLLSPLQLTLLWSAAAIIYLVVTLLLTGFRADIAQSLRNVWFNMELLALLLLFVSATLSAAVLAFPDLYQRRALAWAPVVTLLLFIAVMVGAWLADSPPSPKPVHSIECTASITLTALLPALWTFLSLRRYASTHSQWAGSVALLSAFSVGAIWLRLHEETDSIAHEVVWHYLPMLAIGLIGFWLGKRLLKW
jgi:hypothetical protein